MRLSILECDYMRYLIFTFILFFPTLILASDLQSQLSAIYQAEQQGKAAEKAAAELARKQREDKRKAEENRRKAIARAEQQRKNKAAKLAATKREEQNLEKLLDKQRLQKKEDALFELELEERRLALEEKRARVKRTNDFIDAELKAENASTDVIQSKADAHRNLSKGIENKLTSEGKAAEEKEKGFF